jgi:dipeptidyl-peptidase-4
MRKIIISLTVFFFLASSLVRAGEIEQPQKGKPLDATYLRQHALTRGFMLGRPSKPKPTPDGSAVLFLRSQPRVPKLSLFEFDVASRKTRELLTPEQLLKGAEENLSAEEKARRERQRVSVGGFTDFQLSEDGKQILLSLSGRLYVVERATGGVKELTTSAGTLLDPKFSPDGKSVSYVLDHDLYVFDLSANKERRITTGGTAKKTHGLAEFVAQEEMRRYTGYWWSPDSSHLVYEESDTEGVEVWHVADPIHPENAPLPSYYPRPGKANAKVRVGVIPAAGGETVWIDWDAVKYPYLNRVFWSKHGPLAVQVQTRLQNEVVLLRVDPATGRTAVLLTEKDETWVNLRTDVPRWLPNDRGFLWVSEQDGGPRLEWRNNDGTLKQELVPSAVGFQQLVALDADGERFVFEASDDPTQSRLYLQSFTDRPGNATPLMKTDQRVQQSAVFSKNFKIYALTTIASDALPETTVHELSGRLGELPSVAESPGFTPQLEFVKAGEGPGFYAVIVRPQDFDAKKRYPVILHVYGGPLHQEVLANAQRRLIDQWLADQGFLVIGIDNRGTPGRGRAWERAIYKKFGSVPLDDQITGIKALAAKYPEIDLERIGVHGWSFGGYLAGLSVLRRPDIFKAAVAGAPVVDWLDYDTHYTERYLGLPETDAAAYREASLLTYAPDLKRPLLLVHGTADDNVYFRHTLKLTDALFRAGKDFDVLPLSGLTHMVPDPVVMERLYGRIAGFMQKHLGTPTVR